MITPHTEITTQEMLQKYKEVIEKVKKTKRPTIIVSHKEPQVAIVSMDDLGKLEQIKAKSSARTLLSTAKQVRKILAKENLPTDLSEKHNYYLWEENNAV